METNRASIQGGFLRADMYDEFAEYLAAYVILAKENRDIDINWISLKYESIFIEFYRSCLYHGYGMKEALRAVMDKFEREKINTRILINEDILFPDRVHAFLQPIFADPVTSKYHGEIAVYRHAAGDELVKWVKLTGENQQPVDFGIWQARDGTWQLWSCIRKTKCGGNTRLFCRWEGLDLQDKNWKPMGIAMTADTTLGESLGGLQAPYVIEEAGLYYMFYGDSSRICLAISKDGKEFNRVLKLADGEPDLFTEDNDEPP
jgi:hypothetical protein